VVFFHTVAYSFLKQGDGTHYTRPRVRRPFSCRNTQLSVISPVLGHDQVITPRANRGLALNADATLLYAGYNFRSTHPEVRCIDVVRDIAGDPKDYTVATLARLPDHYGKDIAVDDVGRVYLAEGDVISVYDALLTTQLHTIDTSAYRSDGVAVVREGSALALYSTSRGLAGDQELRRYALTESGGGITAHALAGLGGSGMLAIPGSQDLRGCEVDALGRVWIADIDADAVYRVNTDLTIDSVAVTTPIDVGVDDGQVFVTQYWERTLSVVDADTLGITHVLTPPWAALALDPDGDPSHEYLEAALTGIAVVPGMTFYVANQGGQTAYNKSTYGVMDANSGEEGGVLYMDVLFDDNEPILTVMLIPEPATLALLGFGGVSLFLRRRRRRGMR